VGGYRGRGTRVVHQSNTLPSVQYGVLLLLQLQLLLLLQLVVVVVVLLLLHERQYN
jgi:hypothetical protein